MCPISPISASLPFRMHPSSIRQAHTPPQEENSVMPRFPWNCRSCRKALPHTLPTFSTRTSRPLSKKEESFSAMRMSRPQPGNRELNFNAFVA